LGVILKWVSDWESRRLTQAKGVTLRRHEAEGPATPQTGTLRLKESTPQRLGHRAIVQRKVRSNTVNGGRKVQEHQEPNMYLYARWRLSSKGGKGEGKRFWGRKERG